MALPATYQVLRGDGRHVANGLFKSFDEILDLIKTQPVGIYDIHKVVSLDPNGALNTEYGGEVTKHENGQVSYSPVRSPSRDD